MNAFEETFWLIAFTCIGGLGLSLGNFLLDLIRKGWAWAMEVMNPSDPS